MTVHVPPQWPLTQPPLRLAFVGEAPSHEEVEKGIPLVGPSGRIFDALLRTAGIDRREVLVTNVFDEKLPDNSLASWLAPMDEARAGGFADLPPVGRLGYLRPVHRCHLDRLGDELRLARPNVIVPLGATALWALTGDASITSYRGTVTEAKLLVPGAKLLPTFHPAHVMHQWKFYPVVVGDFIKAMKEADRGPRIALPHKELLLEPTLADLHASTEWVLSTDLLSVDIETGWGQITSVGFAPNSTRAIVLPFLDKRTLTRSYWPTVEDEVEALKWFKMIMESPVPKLGQNFGGYDAYWIWERYKIEPRAYMHDTRLLHHALYPELPKDLEFLGASYTDQGAWKNWGHSKTEKRDD